jgi:hypothetical protein
LTARTDLKSWEREEGKDNVSRLAKKCLSELCRLEHRSSFTFAQDRAVGKVEILAAFAGISKRGGKILLLDFSTERLFPRPAQPINSATEPVFCNAQRNRLKFLFFDGSGLWVCAKRLERGRFAWPQTGDNQGKIVLSHEELSLLLGGIDLRQTRRRPWYREVTGEAPSTACA